jgi:hypothetical protein
VERRTLESGHILGHTAKARGLQGVRVRGFGSPAGFGTLVQDGEPGTSELAVEMDRVA